MTRRQRATDQDSFARAVKAYMEAGGRASVVFAPTQCCGPRITGGMLDCTCWRPVFAAEQQPIDDLVLAELVLGETQPEVRDGMCDDCAYRPGSPEKTGRSEQMFDAAELDQIAADGNRFYCHDGMRVPIAWQHPAGLRIPADPAGTGDYKPHVVCNIPFRVDGRPALTCAGWNARNRALTHPRQEP